MWVKVNWKVNLNLWTKVWSKMQKKNKTKKKWGGLSQWFYSPQMSRLLLGPCLSLFGFPFNLPRAQHYEELSTLQAHVIDWVQVTETSQYLAPEEVHELGWSGLWVEQSCLAVRKGKSRKFLVKWMLHSVSLLLDLTHCSGSVWVELMFFMAAHMVLCFGFGTKTMLITHQCFGKVKS